MGPVTYLPMGVSALPEPTPCPFCGNPMGRPRVPLDVVRLLREHLEDCPAAPR